MTADRRAADLANKWLSFGRTGQPRVGILFVPALVPDQELQLAMACNFFTSWEG